VLVGTTTALDRIICPIHSNVAYPDSGPLRFADGPNAAFTHRGGRAQVRKQRLNNLVRPFVHKSSNI